MPHELVSVVVPLYNKATRIEACLKSVLAQSYPHLEVIVVDDGSTDNGAAVVQSVSDSRVVLLRQENAGVSVARNRGVRAAKGEWIFFLDADDEWKPGLIQALLDLRQQCPDAGVLATPTDYVFANGRRKAVKLLSADFRPDTNYLKDYLKTYVRLSRSPFSNSSFAVKRTIFEASGGYARGVRLTEDSDLWVRLSFVTPIAMTLTSMADYYVEAAGNTRFVVERESFQVTRTLENLLKRGEIPEQSRNSARQLIRLQKLVQLRRFVLTGKRLWALQGLRDPDLCLNRPLASCVVFLSAVTPPKLFRLLRRVKYIMSQ